MIPVTLSKLALLLDGKRFGSDLTVGQVVTDSRCVIPVGGAGETLFIALQGVNFDGHDFAAVAHAAGAKALLVTKQLDNTQLPIDMPQVVVKDSTASLYKLASWVRQQVDARIVALTGSSGKTTVKEMTTAILQQCGATISTFKNQNNHTLGVPLTLLKLTAQHRFAVIEVAASAPGEIALSSAAVRPVAVLINNLSAAHLDGFGTPAGVAQAKGEILAGLAVDGTAIINLDSHDVSHWQEHLSNQRLWRFSVQADNGADFYATQIKQNASGQCECLLHTPFGTIPIALQLLGRHNVANAVAAAALAMAVGADLLAVRHGLAQIPPIPGRLYPLLLTPGQLIIDDSYNANAASMLAAVALLHQLPGYRILVVGDMAALGVTSEYYHTQVAMAIQATTIDQVMSVGRWSVVISRLAGGQHFSDQAALIAELKKLLRKRSEVTILVKGSRSTAMERVIEALQRDALSRAAEC